MTLAGAALRSPLVERVVCVFFGVLGAIAVLASVAGASAAAYGYDGRPDVTNQAGTEPPAGRTDLFILRVVAATGDAAHTCDDSVHLARASARQGGSPVAPKATSVYRVEGPGNARLSISPEGNVGIKGDNTLFVNLGDEART